MKLIYPSIHHLTSLFLSPPPLPPSFILYYILHNTFFILSSPYLFALYLTPPLLSPSHSYESKYVKLSLLISGTLLCKILTCGGGGLINPRLFCHTHHYYYNKGKMGGGERGTHCFIYQEFLQL